MKDRAEIIVPNDLAAARRPEDIILNEIGRCGYGPNVVFAVKLALEEAITNAYRHGNKSDPTKHIRVCYAVTPSRIEIEVGDDGEGFDLSRVPDPTAPGYIDRPHGRGIMLMRAYVDDVQYVGTGNAVRLIKLNK